MSTSPDSVISDEKRLEHIVEHYQDTYDLTHELWRERNNIFLILVIFLALATLLFSLPQDKANSVLATGIGKFVGMSDVQIGDLQTSANFDLLQVLVLAVVFYLTMNLYHRTVGVLRLYKYLGELETDIRSRLNLGDKSVPFTREGTFYWNKRPRLLGWVKYVYIVILALLLGGFLYVRLPADLAKGSWLFSGAEIILTLAIGLYAWGYMESSLKS